MTRQSDVMLFLYFFFLFKCTRSWIIIICFFVFFFFKIQVRICCFVTYSTLLLQGTVKGSVRSFWCCYVAGISSSKAWLSVLLSSVQTKVGIFVNVHSKMAAKTQLWPWCVAVDCLRFQDNTFIKKKEICEIILLQITDISVFFIHESALFDPFTYSV